MTAVTLASLSSGCAHRDMTSESATPAPATTVRAAAAAPSADTLPAAMVRGTASTVFPLAPRADGEGTGEPSESGHTPAATPSPVPGPAIYSVLASPTVVHGGQAVDWDVRTSPDIVRVSAHVNAVTLQLRRLSAGHFGLSFAVPNGVPWFFHGTYNLDVQALTPSGVTLHHGISLTFE